MQLIELNEFTYKFIYVAFVFGTIACNKTLDLDVDTFEPSIAIFGMLEADSVPKLFITESEPYYTYVNKELEYKLIENATITITDGNDIWTLQPDSVNYIPLGQNRNFKGNKSWAFTTKMQLKVNTSYIVNVTKNNTTVTAKTTIIDDVDHFDAMITEEKQENQFVREIMNVKFYSQAYGQFYRILIKRIDTYFECENSIILDTIEKEIISYYLHNKISDTTEVQSQKVNFRSGSCGVFNFCNDDEVYISFDFKDVEVALQVIDSNIVKYINQLQTQEEVAYNPFLEPAPVDHKVENGIGILSSSSTSHWKKFNVLCN